MEVLFFLIILVAMGIAASAGVRWKDAQHGGVVPQTVVCL